MKIIHLIFSIIMLAWCLGFFYFLNKIEEYTLENHTMTDAIVIFGAKKQQLYTGAQLLKLGYAPLILVAGSNPEENYTNFLSEQKLAHEQFTFVNISNNKNSSKSYIQETYTFLVKYQIDSIRLITEADEMPRALKELKTILPITHIIPHPLSPKKKNYNKMFIEYNKYLLVIISTFIGTNNELNLSYS